MGFVRLYSCDVKNRYFFIWKGVIVLCFVFVCGVWYCFCFDFVFWCGLFYKYNNGVLVIILLCLVFFFDVCLGNIVIIVYECVSFFDVIKVGIDVFDVKDEIYCSVGSECVFFVVFFSVVMNV